MAKAKKKTNSKGNTKKPAATKAKSDGENGARKKLPPAKQMEIKLGRYADRLHRLFQKVEGWKEVEGINEARGSLKASILRLKEATEYFAEIPNTYRPRGSRTPRTSLETGMVVRITDRRVKDYEGVLEDGEMQDLKVQQVRGNKILCLTSEGVKCLIARGHLMKQEEATA